MEAVLTRRALNRALLERQMLHRRVKVSAADAGSGYDVVRADGLLQIRLGAVAPAEREAVEAEANRLMEFLAADADTRDIRWSVLPAPV